MLLFEDKITKNRIQFISEVERYSKALGINPNWLMFVMGYETMLTFNPAIVNPISGAVGLIQFMPSTITKEFKITVDKMKSLTNVEQLYYVYLYLKKFTGKMNTFLDVYLAVFFPVAMNKPSDWVFQWGSLSSSVIATQNPGFDLNKDSKVTIGEITTVLVNWLKKKRGLPTYQKYFKQQQK